MEEYINKILEEAPHDMEGITKTLAACHLFNINDGIKEIIRREGTTVSPYSG